MTNSPPARPRPSIVHLGLAIVALGMPGCGDPPCVVSGTVLVDRRPAEGVYVVLSLIGGGPGTARTDGDGRFSIVAERPGEAAITAFWPGVRDEEGVPVEEGDRLGGRYRDPRRPIAKVSVRTGPNPLPAIELQEAPRPGSRRPGRSRR